MMKQKMKGITSLLLKTLRRSFSQLCFHRTSVTEHSMEALVCLGTFPLTRVDQEHSSFSIFVEISPDLIGQLFSE